MSYDHSIPEIVSINQMCAHLHIGRSRLYQMIAPSPDGRVGLLFPPVYALDGRPFFTREVAEKNIELRRSNIGANGKICIAYITTRKSSSVPKQSNRPNKKPSQSHPQYDDLLEGLKALGLTDVEPEAINAVIRQNNLQDIDAGDLLRKVFCAIKAQRSRDNANG